ncbi:hypothetical protein [Glutamicibacter halophytocola]|uniref:hypothetical protein n=1 Tax=Glutamicibacter halophytocola TaxID=1933880 RepID=UPI0015C57029|nr:hypothetical protein [Glutamicibacter halophytocola]NQD42516.1 hypothetical protein [Glutamicibacter halophytocola]
MTSADVLCFAVRRMFWVHIPVIALVLLVCLLTAQIPSGFSGLCAIVAFGWVVLALGDWTTSELRADRLG